jgi:hypothetical protein
MRENERDAESRTDLRNAPIGIDAEGAVHEINPTTRTVVVRGRDCIERREELGERDVSEWIDYVASERGWAEVRYSDAALDEWLAAGLEAEG